MKDTRDNITRYFWTSETDSNATHSPAAGEISSSSSHLQGSNDRNSAASSDQRPTSPLVGLLVVSALITLPYLALRKRVTRSEEALSRITSAAARAQRQQTADVLREQMKLGKQMELLQWQMDRTAGDIKDMRNIMLKERTSIAAFEERFDAMR